MSDALRMERAAFLRCDKCGGDPYVIFRREVKPGGPAWENVVWPNASGVPPIANPERPECPACRSALRRVTG